MYPAHSSVKLTYDDYVLFPDDGKRHELIDGEHYVTAAAVPRHQIIVTNLTGMIWSYLQLHRLGTVFGVAPDVILSRHDVVLPDLLYISRERREALDEFAGLRGAAPNLVVEVASPSTRKRDVTVKKALYERAGIDEYWIVDPDVDTVTVFRRQGLRFGKGILLSHERGDVLTTALLGGLELPLSTIFQE